MRLIMLFIFVFVFSACGKTGDLYLPQDKPEKTPAAEPALKTERGIEP